MVQNLVHFFAIVWAYIMAACTFRCLRSENDDDDIEARFQRGEYPIVRPGKGKGKKAPMHTSPSQMSAMNSSTPPVFPDTYQITLEEMIVLTYGPRAGTASSFRPLPILIPSDEFRHHFIRPSSTCPPPRPKRDRTSFRELLDEFPDAPDWVPPEIIYPVTQQHPIRSPIKRFSLPAIPGSPETTVIYTSEDGTESVEVVYETDATSLGSEPSAFDTLKNNVGSCGRDETTYTLPTQVSLGLAARKKQAPRIPSPTITDVSIKPITCNSGNIIQESPTVPSPNATAFRPLDDVIAVEAGMSAAIVADLESELLAALSAVGEKDVEPTPPTTTTTTPSTPAPVFVQESPLERYKNVPISVKPLTIVKKAKTLEKETSTIDLHHVADLQSSDVRVSLTLAQDDVKVKVADVSFPDEEGRIGSSWKDGMNAIKQIFRAMHDEAEDYDNFFYQHAPKVDSTWDSTAESESSECDCGALSSPSPSSEESGVVHTPIFDAYAEGLSYYEGDDAYSSVDEILDALSMPLSKPAPDSRVISKLPANVPHPSVLFAQVLSSKSDQHPVADSLLSPESAEIEYGYAI